MKTLVIGLGNPILTDDGVGVLVARQVSDRLPCESSIEVAELSVGELRLMEAMIGYDRLIIIDALESEEGNYGATHRLAVRDLKAISPTQHSASPHDASLTTAIEIGRRMGYTLPKEIVIYAAEVENTSDFGETPTPAVARAIPGLVEQVLAEIGNTKKGECKMVSPELLRRYPFFSGFNMDQIIFLAKNAEELNLEGDHNFHTEGEQVNQLFLILEGEVGIITRLPNKKEEVTLSKLISGEVFGWSGLVPPYKATASTKSFTPVKVVAFDADQVRARMAEECDFGYPMMVKIAQIIRERLQDLRIETLDYLSE